MYVCKMATILVFGAGKSSSYLIKYLVDNAKEQGWLALVVDKFTQHLEERFKGNPYISYKNIDITLAKERETLIAASSLVISLLPPDLHIIIAQACIAFKKHLITASYVSENIKALNQAAKENNVLLMCEMGLDPGIDHMSAKQIIDELHSKGAIIKSFKSHCGGLVAPESDNNPWHYKISWNPRNVVLAGQAGAHYLLEGQEVHVPYKDMFKNSPKIVVEDLALAYYPNRDSLSYKNLYELHHLNTLVRTTLRYPQFNKAWQYIIDLELTNEKDSFDTDKLTYLNWLEQKMNVVDATDYLKTLCGPDKESFTLLKFLLLDDAEKLIALNITNSATILQRLLEDKLMMAPLDKDMIVMQHEFEYELDATTCKLNSSLIVIGEDKTYTAMAKTVGLPMAILAKLIFNGTIKNLSGVHIPVAEEVYIPILKELDALGISFKENHFN